MTIPRWLISVYSLLALCLQARVWELVCCDHLATDHRSPFWVISPLTSLSPDLSVVTWLLTTDHRSWRSSPWPLCHLVHMSPFEWSTWFSVADVIDHRWPIGSTLNRMLKLSKYLALFFVFFIAFNMCWNQP